MPLFPSRPSPTFGYISDATVLWLDNHRDHSDFFLFSEREQLRDWLPDRQDDLLALFIETKLNYLGWPKLATQITDIPKRSDDEEFDDEIKEALSQIHSPEFVITQDDSIRLEFFVWTQKQGYLIKIVSLWTNDEIQVDASILASYFGKYAILR